MTDDKIRLRGCVGATPVIMGSGKMVKLLLRSTAAVALLAVPALVSAKTVKVRVDAKSVPWNVRANPTMRFGINDGRPPTLVLDPAIKVGTTITISAKGSTLYGPGSPLNGPDGDRDWYLDRGNVDFFPSHYMRGYNVPIYRSQLVGAFVSADGIVVSSPFPIGREAKVVVPAGAAGISLGLNDEVYADNSGSLDVSILIAVGTVTVEEGEVAPNDAAQPAGPTASAAPATPAAEATVQRVTVTLDAATAPWDPVANAGILPIGAKGAKPTVVVPIEVPAGKVVIVAEGTTDIPGASGIGAGGDTKKTINDTVTADGQRYPSFYVPKLLYPAYRHGLVVVFVDAKGVAVSRPFMVGKGIRLPIPDKAEGLALGFNDTDFTGNTGTLKVTVELPPQ
ncbi:hypothetical protein FHT00_003604 [Sphingomonas insulae]|uniref:hypothetical protein n=1 Tax=Sphingomonas insulae TaxID=424800 RepID=UPI0031D59A51|nr:hypothetical protein [Sphingomonas insulae]